MSSISEIPDGYCHCGPEVKEGFEYPWLIAYLTENDNGFISIDKITLLDGTKE